MAVCLSVQGWEPGGGKPQSSQESHWSSVHRGRLQKLGPGISQGQHSSNSGDKRKLCPLARNEVRQGKPTTFLDTAVGQRVE